MHSTHLKRMKDKDSKTQKQWEDELGITGYINHMKSLGYDSYQWNQEDALLTQEGRERMIKEHGTLEPFSHYVEFFSKVYNGYVRADSYDSLKDALNKAVNKAQKYFECEQKNGHDYVPYSYNGKEYDNGLLKCKHCGFHGYTNIVKLMNLEVEHYKVLVDSLSKERAIFIRNAQEFGVTFNISGRVLDVKKNTHEAMNLKAQEILSRIENPHNIDAEYIICKLINRIACENVDFLSLKLEGNPAKGVYIFTGKDSKGREIAFDLEDNSKTRTILFAVTINATPVYYDTLSELSVNAWYQHDILFI